MATLYTDIYSLFRTLIGDSAQYQEDTIDGDGSTVTFVLTEDNVVVDAFNRVDAVYINGVLCANYSVDFARGWITFVDPPANSSTVVVQYRYYKSFTDAELKNYLQLAVGRLNLSGYSTWTVSDTAVSETLVIKDKYLICAIGAVIIDPNVRVTWETGEIRYSSAKSGRTGDDLITDLITQAKLTGAICSDIIVELSGINNIYNILDEERDDESDIS